MANIDFSVRNVKVYPEVIPITSAIASLPAGQTDMIRIWQNPDKSKVVKGLDFNFDAIDNVNLNLNVDKIKLDQLHTNSLPGVNEPFSVSSVHEQYWSRDQTVYTLSNNTGGAVTNFRSMARILVDDLTTVDKLLMGYKLDSPDQRAIDNLKSAGIDIMEKSMLGVGIPSDFSQFLAEHGVKGPYNWMESLPQGTNLSAVPVNLIDMDVPNKGQEAMVLETIWCQVGNATDIGNVQLVITRDDDINYITLDPACFPQNSNFNGNMVPFQIHVHAFDHLTVSVKQSGGTHNGFKASIGVSRRNIGLAFKYKLLEFSGLLPKNVDISPAEKALADKLNLADWIRSGLYPVG